jgi:hypothetical protein
MPLSLAQGGALAVDATFRLRVAMGFYYVARQVFTEGNEVTGHENRERFARSIVYADQEAFQLYAAMVATDPTIVAATPASQSAVTDTQIISAIQAMWNTLAQVNA